MNASGQTAPDSTSSAGKRNARILICDDLSAEAYEIFEEAGFAPETRTGLSEDELVEIVGDVDAIVVRSATKITRRVIEAAGRLRIVGRAGVGVDNVDLEAATERGVVVMNAPTGNTTTTAELAIALLCALARNIPRADRLVRSGVWKKRGLMGTELTHKTLGVVGLGRIGRVVAKRALGLSMNVVAYDPFLTPGQSPVEGVELVELDDLVASADFVTLHVPLNESTRHIISRKRIAAMKPGARLINAARGGLIDEVALLEALESGHLRGAALDVFESEPPAPDNPLLARDDVIITPHLGASSDEAQRQVASDIARQISQFLDGGVAHNAVNAPALSAQTLHEIGPFVLLAEKLGSFLAQRSPAPLRTLELTVSGDIAAGDTSHVRLALLVGVLRHGTEAPINFVNAPHLAEERGLKLIEDRVASTAKSGGVGHLTVRALSRRAQGGEHSYEIAGTVLGREPRITRIDDVSLDMRPAGPVLITTHDDEPGVVGLLGTLLGKHGLNIRRFELGPPAQADSGPARGFLTLYERPTAEVIAEIAALGPVRHVQLIEL